jgi:hypothetical protein
MFSILVSGGEFAWESDRRMAMDRRRFGSYSGDELATVSLDDPAGLRRLEQADALLMYEIVVSAPHASKVRVGRLSDIRVEPGRLTFLFHDSGRLLRETVHRLSHYLQLENFELNHTHWAVKDGELPQDVLREVESVTPMYDVVLSFAGENRDYVEQVAGFLKDHNVRVFYDDFDRAALWGKNLIEHFDEIYQRRGRFCVMFISEHYASKMWTRHERRSALERALGQRSEYILPARFDDTTIPGLSGAVRYEDLQSTSPNELGHLILRKLGRE